MSKLSFADELAALCAREMIGARRNPERAAEMAERLLSSLAFTVAMACGGDQKAMGVMLDGATAYLYE
ncbi:MAG TPA: hypothetical protein VN579_04280, partial [Bryobacteraceae bacterium]|nr:hypothetical protein [Bryobacteraceae bacterium]